MKVKFTKTDLINKLLADVEVLRIVFETLPILPHVEENLRREAILKSSLFSARIEGNPLTLEEVQLGSKSPLKRDISKLEIFNLLKAYRYVFLGKIPKKVSVQLISQLHKIVMQRISPEAGRLRNGPGAIFNQAGVAIYLAPPHQQVLKLLNGLANIANISSHPPAVNSATIHFRFEKIHPFADGNGRVGRLLSACILRNGGYGFKGLISFEEFIDKNRELYYRTLEAQNDMTEFVEFFLESLVTQAKLVLDKLKEKDRELPEDNLLPRRREILNIIRDHPYCSFDLIRRRFLAVNPKTLHYDLGKLQLQGFVQKIGVSRGSVYKVKSRNF